MFVFIGFCMALYGQANDNFSGAELIQIGNNGRAIGLLRSSTVDLTQSGLEQNEFAPALAVNQGLDFKSVWFRFELVTARSVSISLKQRDTMIAQDQVGFAVYKNPAAYPASTELDNSLPTITKFGSSTNRCTKPDIYYVQVLANSKANDSIWLEINLQEPSDNDYDYRVTAKKLGLIDSRVFIEFDAGCYTLDESDEDQSDSTYSQSIWLTFKTGEHPDFGLLNVRKAMDDVKLYCYEGDSRQGNSGLNLIEQGKKQILFECGLKPKTTYSVCLVLKDKEEGTFLFEINVRGFGDPAGADPNSLGNRFKLGQIPSGRKRVNLKEFVDCKSEMTRYACDNVIPDSVEFINGLPFTHHVLITFELEDSALFIGDVVAYTSDKTTAPPHSFPKRFRLFQGSITDKCKLDPYELDLRSGTCLEPGNYTLQIIFPKKLWNYSNTYLNGSILDISLGFKTKPDLKYAQHYEPTNPDTLGNFGPYDSLGALRFTTALEQNHKSPDTSYVLGGKSYSGHFIFREFFLSEDSYLRMREFTNGLPGFIHYLFKGSIEKNRGSEVLVSEDFGRRNPFYRKPNGERIFRSNCTKLSRGGYTLVSVLPASCFHKFYAYSSAVRVEIFQRPEGQYNHPYKAQEVDSLNPLTWADDYGPNNAPRYRKEYRFPDDFFGCEPDTPIYAPPGCVGSNDQAAYYVFNLKEPSFLLVNNGILFQLDVRKDSLKFLDSSNAIAPCSSNAAQEAQKYFNLQPGIYTLVLIGEEVKTPIPSITISPVIRPKNDHAKFAYDMGHLDAKEKKSKGEFVSCAVTQHATDYPPNNYLGKRPKVAIPVEKNTFVEPSFAGNLWYTFTVENAGEIRLWFKDLNGDIEHEEFYAIVYEAKDGAHININELRHRGLIDSSMKQGLVPVAIDRPRMRDSLRFYKTTCDSTRYFVVVNVLNYDGRYSRNNEIPNYNFQLVAQLEPQPLLDDRGDFCENAKTINLTDNDKESLNLNVSCHTIGESFGEDGSNMGCLGNVNEVKTSWYRLNYNGTQKNDLSFRFDERTNNRARDFKYRILYGGCNSMTAGPCVTDLNSFFKLDCMAKGEYFIQVSSPNNTVGHVTITATSTTSDYQICEPVDPLAIKSHFVAIGGCSKGSQIQFENYSTQGGNIEYLWDFDDGNYSTLKRPTHTYASQSSGTDTFWVKLTVRNVASDRIDSVTRAVYLFDDLEFELGNDTFNFCDLTVKPDLDLNFIPTGITWSNAQYSIDSPEILQPNLRGTREGFPYFLELAYQNCVLTDSINILRKFVYPGDWEKWTCKGQKIKLSGRSESYPIYRWSNNDTARHIYVAENGIFSLEFGYNENCLTTYNYEVHAYDPPEYEVEDLPICRDQPIVVSKLNSSDEIYIRWEHNQSNEFSIPLDDTGWYYFYISNPNCGFRDSLYLNPNHLIKPQFTHITSCDSPATLEAPLYTTETKYSWNTGQNSRVIEVSKAGNYTVVIEEENCEVINEYTVSFSKIPNLNTQDIYLCDGHAKTLSIDSTLNVEWFDGSKSNRKTFRSSGTYWYEVEDKGCSKKVSFEVKTQSIPQPDLGNDTSLCPPVRLELRSPSADTILWSNGERNHPITIVHDSGYHWVQLRENGCLKSDSIYIELKDCESTLYIPNAFTPDNKNPIFKPKGVRIESFNMKIFNRWGQLLFETHDIDKGWDGTFRGEACAVDQYIYVIYYKFEEGAFRHTSGGFTLIR